MKELLPTDILIPESFRPINDHINSMRLGKPTPDFGETIDSDRFRQREYFVRMTAEILDKLPKEIFCIHRGIHAFGSLNMVGSTTFRSGVVNEVKFGSENNLIKEMFEIVKTYDVYLVSFVNYSSSNTFWVNWDDGYEANFLARKSIERIRSRSLKSIGI